MTASKLPILANMLANGRLVRQYYNDYYGRPYYEISYTYDSDGRLTGRTEVSVSSDGTRTE